ncbi:MAG: hypothetical protein WBB65_09240 [Anaerolineales bacterium]
MNSYCGSGVFTKILSGNYFQYVGNVIPGKSPFREGFQVFVKRRHHSINHFDLYTRQRLSALWTRSLCQVSGGISANHRVTMVTPFNKEMGEDATHLLGRWFKYGLKHSFR